MIADWVMVVVTTVYAVSTLFIMKANIKTAKSTQKQIQQSNEHFEKQQRLAIRPYLNGYVEREGKEKSGSEHLHIYVGMDEDPSTDYRQISFRNIGNGTAKNIKIRMSYGDSSKELLTRNGFLLINNQYVYNLHMADSITEVRFEFRFTDLFNNEYVQNITIYYDPKKKELVAQTDNSRYVGNDETYFGHL